MTDQPDRVNDIIARALASEASAEEMASLAAWREEDPGHEAQYRQTERLLAEARSLGAPAGMPPRLSAATIVSAVERAQLASYGARSSRRWLVAGAAAVATAAVVATVLVVRPRTPAPAWANSEVVTGINELATVKLPDGTVVRLGPSTRLRVTGDRAREVALDGRAFFAVAKMPNQPFRVVTSTATANVLGTRFELATDAKGVRLTVLEGRVALAAAENSVEVGAGQQSEVERGAATPPVAAGPAATSPTWLGKFMVFQATPLRTAAREIEQLYQVDVQIADSALAEATITATFTDRPVDDVVGVICAVLNARCTSQDRIVSINR